jgi:hypothetical protein
MSDLVVKAAPAAATAASFAEVERDTRRRAPHLVGEIGIEAFHAVDDVAKVAD